MRKFSTSGDEDIQYIRGCSVHGGDIMSILWHVQYIRGYHDECEGIPCVHRGCSVHRRDTMSTSAEYHEHIGRCSVYQRDIMMHVGEQLDKCFQFLLKTPMY